MSYCKSNGKDKTIFVTKEDAGKPPVVSELLDRDQYGAILPDGSINWDCPCLGGLPSGPCGEEFKASFSCFHYSTADPQGSDCIEQFVAMQECFKGHPELYSKYDNDEEGDSKEESIENGDNDEEGDSKEESIENGDSEKSTEDSDLRTDDKN